MQEFENLLEQSMMELQLKTTLHDDAWHLGESAWNVDQERGEIVFTTPNGMKATASVQIVGTFNTLDNSWMWSWANPSFLPALQQHALEVKAYGEARGLDLLTESILGCKESLAWRLTALTTHLADAQGAYRGPAGSNLVFMTFGDVTLSR